jgi:hypothetical protein
LYMYRPDLRAALTTLLSCPLSSRTLLKRTNKKTTSQSADETRTIRILSSVGFDAASSRRNVRVVQRSISPTPISTLPLASRLFGSRPRPQLNPIQPNPTQPCILLTHPHNLHAHLCACVCVCVRADPANMSDRTAELLMMAGQTRPSAKVHRTMVTLRGHLTVRMLTRITSRDTAGSQRPNST